MSIDQVLQTINKKHGEGSIFRLNDSNILNVDRISTGSLALDKAIGGGIPVGRIVTVVGQPSAGKTTILCHILAEAQKKFPNKYVAIVDVEHALDRTYTEALGVDLDRAVISQPDMSEEAWNIVEELIKSGEFSTIFLDSIAAMTPRAEVEGEIGDANIAVGARLNGQAMRKLTPMLQEKKTTLLLANQLRENINTFGYGEKTVSPGGKAIDFFASVILSVARKTTNKEKGEAVSSRTIVKVKKNKVAPPLKEAEFDIVYGVGIDKNSEMIELGTELGIVAKRGSYFYFTDFETGVIAESGHQGKPKAVSYLEDNPQYAEQLRNEIKKRYD